jgi:hypothetical protein
MKSRSILLFLLLFTLVGAVLVAQDDGETETDPLSVLESAGLTVQPLDVVTESPEQILDLMPTSARLNFVGTIPLACTVVFGETTDFGNASVDPDMNGATLIDHNPLLLDLEPDTEYFYRVQGSGVDGTFYVGEIQSFRTPPESDDVTDNLLSPERGAEVIGVSSNFGGNANDENWGVLRAFDGNVNTAWSSDGDGDDAWFEVELGQRSQINTVAFETRAMSDGSSEVDAFEITTDSGETYGPFEVPAPGETGEYEVDFVASTLRFDVVSSTGGNTGAMEIAVYGEPVEE